MGLIVTPEQYERRRQPQVGIRLRQRHSLAKGLTTAAVPLSLEEMWCAVRKRKVSVTSSSATFGVGPAGRCYRVGNAKKITVADNLIPGQTHSAVVILRFTANLSPWTGIFYTRSDTAAFGLELQDRGGTGDAGIAFNGGYDLLTGVKTGLAKDRLLAIGWVHDHARSVSYVAVNGSLRSGDGSTAAVGISGITVGWAPYDGFAADFEFYGMLAWDRGLSRGAIAAATLNPNGFLE